VEQFTVHYKFSHRFPFPAQEVYDWATDYQPDDIRLWGGDGARVVERLDGHTLILTDTVRAKGKSETKVRMVRLFPEQLLWTNTRISEAGKYSQFIYQVVAEGPRKSRLDFTGAQIEYAAKRPSPARLSKLAKEIAEKDALIWVGLGEAIAKDLGRRRSPRTSRS
jgi:hypothetical protein